MTDHCTHLDQVPDPFGPSTHPPWGTGTVMPDR
jgi:hypothetical protein